MWACGNGTGVCGAAVRMRLPCMFTVTSTWPAPEHGAVEETWDSFRVVRESTTGGVAKRDLIRREDVESAAVAFGPAVALAIVVVAVVAARHQVLGRWLPLWC